MHELRALVAERSRMSIHIRGELIEIRPNNLGILLEGFVKTQGGQQDLVSSPAVFLPLQADYTFTSLESSGKVLSLSVFFLLIADQGFSC
jgi:hypothetical protein